jgi:L-alanine-DL-glutamate epimerase-like enolase superfamily enzyme
MNDLTRRTFLKCTAGGMMGLTMANRVFAEVRKPLTIAAVDLYPVRYPTVMRFKFFEGPVSSGGRPAVIIKITADDGTEGWGESVPLPRWSYETLESAASTLANYLKPVLVGMDPFDLDGIHAVMNREIANGFSTGAPITKAGVDIALHDLIGHALGLNIAAFWGRTLPDALTLSWTLNPKTLDEIPGLIQKGRDRGYAHFNVKVAPDPDFDLALCRRVKELSPEGFLWADANGGYDLATALEVIPRLAETGVDVLEQPIPPNHVTGYQRLHKLGALPILLDEGMVSPTDAVEFIRLGCCDGIAMKPARCGGLKPASEQIEVVQRAGLLFLGSGLTDPDISLAASLILYGAYGLKHPAALNGPQFLGESVLRAPLKVIEGRISIPKGPGLGIDVDEDKVKDLCERSSA